MVRPRKLSPADGFWQRLREASDFSGIPCEPGDIAKELDIWPSAVTKYIEGKFPSKKNINKLAIRRKVRSEWLLSGQGEMVAEEALDEETLEALKLWRQLDDSARQRILISLRHEFNSADSTSTGKRRASVDEMSKHLESGSRSKTQ
jgi:transcriptional regulator with XRE-family HTH domain